MPRRKHPQLTANTVATVTLDVPANDTRRYLEVLHVSGTSPVYIRIDGTLATVRGDDCEVVPVAGAPLVLRFEDGQISNGVLTVSLISAAAADVAVRTLLAPGSAT